MHMIELKKLNVFFKVGLLPRDEHANGLFAFYFVKNIHISLYLYFISTLIFLVDSHFFRAISVADRG